MDAEVIIVGAGPAGTTCARLLAEQHRSVLILERSKTPRDKPCGGWVNLRAFEDFPELEKLRTKAPRRNPLVESDVRGLEFHDPDGGRTAAYSSRKITGFTVCRDRFDAHLLDLAAETGSNVSVRERCRIVGVEVSEDGVSVTDSRGRVHTARVLVGADGADSTVARTTGLVEAWPANRQVLCRVKDVPLDARTVTRLYGKTRRLHVCLAYRGVRGYAWAFPKRRSVSVGVGFRGDDPADLYGAYDSWADYLREAGLLTDMADVTGASNAAEPAGGAIDFEGHVGKHVVLIGDAGGFVSAATGEGIYPAMLSARVAARCIDDALAADNPQDKLLEFKFAWRREFAEYLQMPNANLAFLLPLIYDNQELCARLARCFLFGDNF